MQQAVNRILLLGAGFSRNWGGWLGDEVFEYLLGHPCIVQNPSLKSVLWRHKEKRSGFENALAEIQNNYRRTNSEGAERNLSGFQSALVQMFADMNAGYKRHEGFDIGLQKFLGNFDAIFTLNQDLLIEMHYKCGNSVSVSPSISKTTHLMRTLITKWTYWQTPGVAHPGNNIVPHPTQIAENWNVSKNPSDFILKQGLQPFFKLHGSCNWRNESGEGLLVMGGDKDGSINSNPLLTWYHEQFNEYLMKPETRIMVIGYSFQDAHINATLMRVAQANTDFGLFIIDPHGVDVITRINNGHDVAIKGKSEEEKTLFPVMRGASRRSLDEIFKQQMELNKLNRFLGFSYETTA